MDSPDYTRKLLRLLEVCRNLSASLTLESLLHSIIEVASELTQSEATAILLQDPEQGYLRYEAAPWYQMDALWEVVIPLEGSSAGWAFSHASPLLLHEADPDKDAWGMVDHTLTETPQSLLAVPIMLGGSAIGVIECVNKARGAHYFEDDIFVLETLASQAAAAIHRQRLTDCADAAGIARREVERLKSDFVAIASHELRTPLGLIIGHTMLLQEDLSGPQREQADAILHGAERMQEVIEQLSDVSSITSGKAKALQNQIVVALAVQEAVDAFQEFAQQRQVALSVKLPQERLVLVGDREGLQTVLNNLIKNALTFTNEGGQVEVRVEGIPGFMKVTVADNGIGIPTAEQGKIFERFYQVEKHLTRRHGGMGLGLSIARDIVEGQGGRIWVESEEGVGSRFMFVLPLDLTQAKAAEQVFLG